MVKKKTDERLEKESNVLTAKMFYLITFLLLVSLAVKLACRLPLRVCALEALCLLTSGIYFLVHETGNGILGVREKDEALSEIHRSILSRAFQIDFSLLLVGELVFIYALDDYLIWALSYLATWMPPALVITIASIKNGWLVRVGQAQGRKGKKTFLLSVVMGSAVFGILMGFPELYHDGAFHAKGLLYVLGMAAGWGIPFFLIMNFLVGRSEKRADQRLEEADQDEE